MRRSETCWSAPTIPRVLTLSDGVFAVVITLLVLEIHVPELTQGHSLAERSTIRSDRKVAACRDLHRKAGDTSRTPAGKEDGD